ncbi:hypothetical protein DL93DRAFT_2168371 [Clavulina sp. PMI_390]|nr:hypothetical protein DL93DRAFT_2168371 [Clavulina sp. PMI_390]
MGNSKSVPSVAATEKMAPLLFKPLEPRLTPIGLSKDHIYKNQVVMRCSWSDVVFISECPAEGVPEDPLEDPADEIAEGAGGADEATSSAAPFQPAEPMTRGVAYRFHDRIEKLRVIRTIVNTKKEPIISLMPKGWGASYTLYRGRQTLAGLTPSVEQIGLVRCTKYGSGMSADLTFNNFGDTEQPLKLILSAETKWGGACVIRLGGSPVGYLVRKSGGLAYWFSVAAGVDVTLMIAIMAAIEKARPKGG